MKVVEGSHPTARVASSKRSCSLLQELHPNARVATYCRSCFLLQGLDPTIGVVSNSKGYILPEELHRTTRLRPTTRVASYNEGRILLLGLPPATCDSSKTIDSKMGPKVHVSTVKGSIDTGDLVVAFSPPRHAHGACNTHLAPHTGPYRTI